MYNKVLLILTNGLLGGFALVGLTVVALNVYIAFKSETLSGCLPILATLVLGFTVSSVSTYLTIKRFKNELNK